MRESARDLLGVDGQEDDDDEAIGQVILVLVGLDDLEGAAGRHGLGAERGRGGIPVDAIGVLLMWGELPLLLLAPAGGAKDRDSTGTTSRRVCLYLF